MREDIIKRLESLGYAIREADSWLIDHLIGKVTNSVKNECNIDAVPEGLRQIAVDMACGEFLLAKKGSGQLDSFDVEAAVKQIKEGDTSVTYAIQDDSITLDGLISCLANSGKSQFASFRRLAW
jgi:hypothetical protein